MSETAPPPKPSEDPKTFEEFLKALDDLSLDKKEPTNAKTRQDNPLEGYTYATAKSIYDKGIKELKKTVFCSADDAVLSLRAVIKRAFPLMALNSSYRPKVNTTYIGCSKCSKEPDLESVKKYLGHDSRPFSKGRCSWTAAIKEKPDSSGFFFSYIHNFYDHHLSCFVKNPNKTFKLNEAAAESSNNGELLPFNELLSSKAGIIVTSEGIYQHNSHLKKKEEAKLINAYVNASTSCSNGFDQLSKEDKAILGLLEVLKKEDPHFNYKCEVSDTKEGKSILSCISCIWPDQVELISMYGDVIFIDSTFGVNKRDYNAINLVIIDNHLKTRLAATAFVRNEFEDGYITLLNLVKESVPKQKRLTMCLVSDSAPQIHSAVSKIIPYCRHIHCAFHIVRERALLAVTKGINDSSERDVIRRLVATMFVTNSFQKMEASMRELYCKSTEAGQSQALREAAARLISYAAMGSRALQDVFTANTIASSRVESINSVMKKGGFNKRTPLFGCVPALKEAVKQQAIDRVYDVENKNHEWKFLSNKDFESALSKEAMEGITSIILEKMHDEFVLSQGSYNVIKKSKGTYLVVYKDTTNPHDEHYVVHSKESSFQCHCSIRMGYPCRHTFAVVASLNAGTVVEDLDSEEDAEKYSAIESTVKELMCNDFEKSLVDARIESLDIAAVARALNSGVVIDPPEDPVCGPDFRIALPAVNSRFRLNQSRINFEFENKRAEYAVFRSVVLKKKRCRALLNPKKNSDITWAVVTNGFKKIHSDFEKDLASSSETQRNPLSETLCVLD